MCSYCKEFDHTIKECLQLIAKWKSKNLGNSNQLQNANQNIQNIFVEPRDHIIVVVIRGFVVTGEDQDAPCANLRV